jgi:hypothetical protein
MGRVTGRKGSKKLFKNPVDNEPLPYEILPAGHPPMPPKHAQEEGLRGIDGCQPIGYHTGPPHCKPHLKSFLLE